MEVNGVIQWVCVSVFAITAAIALLALTGRMKLGDGSSADQKYYVRRLFGALILQVAVVSVAAFSDTISGGRPGLPAVVPPREPVTVDSLPAPSTSEFELLRDMSLWDLRGWREVPPNKTADRVSPAHYLNYLHVKKRMPVNTYTAHYSTGGAAIDLRSITHASEVFKEGSQQHPGELNYAVKVDVSGVPVGQEFLIVIEATYWNGFQRQLESAATYTDNDIGDLGELGMIVLFPDGKPFQDVRRVEVSEERTERDYRQPDTFYADRDGRFIYWDVRTRQPNKHYKLTWKW